MTKREVLAQTTFGQRVAEEEIEALKTYFVETDQWRQIVSGEIDIIEGAKGSGKSAIYSLLSSRDDLLSDRGIRIIQAENPRGTPAFKDLPDIKALSEVEFRFLWKLYFLSLVVNRFRDEENPVLKELQRDVVDPLESAGVIVRKMNLRGIIRSVIDYIHGRSWMPASVEGGTKLDPSTGAPVSVTGKVTFEEPSRRQRDLGFVSVDSMAAKLNEALAAAGVTVWILLDRLDVAFAESTDLEIAALRGLLRVYLDFRNLSQIPLKVFLRTDIWRGISERGFREASHITRKLTIEWNEQSLLDLVARRMLYNRAICEYYEVDRDAVLRSTTSQRNLFYRVFPEKVVAGRNPNTIRWMLSHTSDGAGQNAPRELIHLLNEARGIQLRRLETGSSEPQNGTLFERSSLRDALPEVSRVRLHQTLLQEYPDLSEPVLSLEGRKAIQTLETLSHLWNMDAEQTKHTARRLVDLGFFEPPTPKRSTYVVPFLYRPALNMVRGSE